MTILTQYSSQHYSCLIKNFAELPQMLFLSLQEITFAIFGDFYGLGDKIRVLRGGQSIQTIPRWLTCLFHVVSCGFNLKAYPKLSFDFFTICACYMLSAQKPCKEAQQPSGNCIERLSTPKYPYFDILHVLIA